MINRSSKQKLMTQTISTLPHTQTFSHFKKPLRDNRRLNSTIRFQPLQTSKRKFSPVDQRCISWCKWKSNNLPIVSQGFAETLKSKAERAEKENFSQQRSSGPQLKIRHKIREVVQLQGDIERARQNNKLIKEIDIYHQTKINSFFEQYEQLLHGNTQ